MTYFVLPQDGQEVRGDNLVIGYYNGKAIIKNEDNFLFFIECEECHAPQGTVVENGALNSINELEREEQETIKKLFQVGSEG